MSWSLAQLFVLSSAAIIGLLGAAHLVLTFRGDAFEARDADLTAGMDQVPPKLTGETTMWRAWIGFNASHSLGALLFAAFYGWLALTHPELLLASEFLLLLGLIVLGSYLWLASRYWFSKPRLGIALALIAFSGAIVTDRVAGDATEGRFAEQRAAADALFAALTARCGEAYEGVLAEGTEPSDAEFASGRMVMHIRDCTDEEIRMPFQIGEDRSRTWVLTRLEDRVRLKHIHRHEDGHEDAVSRYGGETVPGDDGLALAFFADAYTAELLPVSGRNIWVMSHAGDGSWFEYQLLRPHEDRRFRVRFDLTTPVETPPDNW